MPRYFHSCSQQEITCDGLISLPSENLARQSQAVMCDVVHSRTMKGAPSMNRAADLEQQAAEELSRAPLIAGPSDGLDGNHRGLASPSRCHPIPDKCRGSFSIPRSRRAGSTHGVCVNVRLWETGHWGADPRHAHPAAGSPELPANAQSVGTPEAVLPAKRSAAHRGVLGS
jgi:hypothetical protein